MIIPRYEKKRCFSGGLGHVLNCALIFWDIGCCGFLRGGDYFHWRVSGGADYTVLAAETVKRVVLSIVSRKNFFRPLI
jgi:hypothetical protein